MKALMIACLSLMFCVGLVAADKAVENLNKALSGSDSAKKKQAINACASGGEDDDRIPVLIKALGDRQVKKFALDAIERRTGLKPALRSGTNPGYPGYPATRDKSGWSKWWSAKKKEEADKAKIAELEKKAKEIEEKADEALDPDAKKDGDAEATEGDGSEVVKVAEKKVVPDHEKYGKVDRVIFKNGNLLMCYIISKQVDLDGKLTSIDIVHKNGAGQESLDAKMISTFEENIK